MTNNASPAGRGTCLSIFFVCAQEEGLAVACGVSSATGLGIERSVVVPILDCGRLSFVRCERGNIWTKFGSVFRIFCGEFGRHSFSHRKRERESAALTRTL